MIEKAQTDYLLAKEQYKEELQEYNKWDHKRLTDPQRAAALTRLLAARQKMDRLFATYNWYLQMPTTVEIAQADADLAVAEANLVKAQADYDSLKNGPGSAEVAMAKAQPLRGQRLLERVKDGPNSEDIDAAQAAVEAAQATLDQVRLLAPFAGTVTEVDTQVGDMVSSGSGAFRIDDLASLYVDLQVSEVDVNSLQIGQPAELTFDAVPDKQYSGEVAEIGMVGVVTQGVVNYPVTVRITNPDSSVRPGMTAAVSIVIDRRENVLMVPNQAIRISAGQRTVTVLYEGQQISVAVNVGLVNELMSEVSGEQLREGDTVVINTSSATSSSNNNQQFQRMPGGGHLRDRRRPTPVKALDPPISPHFRCAGSNQPKSTGRKWGTPEGWQAQTQQEIVKMKKWIYIAGGIVLLLGLCAGSFYGGITYQRSQVQQIQNEFMQARGFPQGTPGAGGVQPGQGGGQPRTFIAGGGGVSGQVKTVEGNTLTLSTAEDVTTVIVSDDTQITLSVSGSLADLQTGQRVMVTGERDASGQVNALRISILGEEFAGPPAAP